MSVAPNLSTARHWLLPTCGERCRPGDHDPHWHEAVGLRVALWAPPATVVRTGSLVVDVAARRASIGGSDVRCSSREWGVLEYLALRAGRRCLTREILVGVWGPAWDRGGCEDMRPLRVTMSRLRAKLGAAASLIESSLRSVDSWYCLRLEPTS